MDFWLGLIVPNFIYLSFSAFGSADSSSWLNSDWLFTISYLCYSENYSWISFASFVLNTFEWDFSTSVWIELFGTGNVLDIFDSQFEFYAKTNETS